MSSPSNERKWLDEVFGVGGIDPDADAEAYEQARAKRVWDKLSSDRRVLGRIEAASRFDKQVDKAWRDAQKLAGNGEHAEAVAALEQLRVDAGLAIDKRRGELQPLFGRYRDAQMMARQIVEAPDNPNKPTAEAILECGDKAVQARKDLAFAEAQSELDKALREHDKLQKQLQAALKQAEKDTQAAAGRESEAFALYGGDTERMQAFILDKNLAAVTSGLAVTETGLEKSETLKQMEAAFTEALKRYDDLKAKGATPPDAADIALANIPRAFWPDRAIREIDMFARVQNEIELEDAREEAKSLSEELYETEVEVAETYTDVIDTLATVPNEILSGAETHIRQLTGLNSLPDVGSSEFNQLPADKQNLIAWHSETFGALGDAMTGVGQATGGIGVAVNLAKAVKAGVDASKEHAGPVQAKIAEFERNQAIFDLCMSAKDYGVSFVEEACPVIGVISKGVDAGKAAYEACCYFVMLANILKLGKKAERDPQSVVYLPLARMAKHESIKGAQSTLDFVTSSLEMAGKIGEMSGMGAPAGIAIDVSGKIIAAGGKVVFASIKWSDAAKAKGAIAAAKGPPIDREAVAMVFKYSNKYATYCLAIAAVEDRDPWATKYCLANGLKEAEVRDPATSIMILRKYILLKAEMEDEQQTFGDSMRESLIGKAVTGIGDKLEQRRLAKLPKYEEDEVLDPVTGESLPNPNAWRPPAAELTAEAWQRVKQDAINHGWHDDGSGLDQALSGLSGVLAGWNKSDVTSTNTVYMELGRLCALIRGIKPLANDRKTPHTGMESYLGDLLRLADDKWTEASELREQLIDTQTFGGGDPNADPETIERNKQKALSEAYEEFQKQQKQRLADTREKVQQLVDKQSWPTPFGKSTLAKYADLAATKLGLSDPMVVGELSTRVGEVGTLLCDKAMQNLSAYAPGDVAKPFKTVVDALLSGLANEALAEAASQARDQAYRLEHPDSSPRDRHSWDSSSHAIGINPAFWDAAVKAANTQDQMQTKGTSDVSKAFGKLRDKHDLYQKVGAELQESEVQDALRQLEAALDKFDPVDADGLPYEPMIEYITRLRQSYFPFLREKLKEGPSGAWKPSKVELTESGWKSVKAEAKKNGLQDTKSGIGAVLKSLDSARRHEKTTEELKWVSALDAAATTIEKYMPTTSKKETHPGMERWRKLALVELKRMRKEAAARLVWTKPLPPSASKADQWTKDKWDKDKAVFIRYGLKDSTTGIGKSLAALEKARKALEKNKKPAKAERLKQSYVGAIQSLAEALSRFKPVSAMGEFEPALAYRRAFLEQCGDLKQRARSL